MAETQPLVLLPKALADAGYDGAPSYRSIYDSAVSCHFPAERNTAGRWEFDPSNLHLIADALGLSQSAD